MDDRLHNQIGKKASHVHEHGGKYVLILEGGGLHDEQCSPWIRDRRRNIYGKWVNMVKSIYIDTTQSDTNYTHSVVTGTVGAGGVCIATPCIDINALNGVKGWSAGFLYEICAGNISVVGGFGGE